MRQRGRLFDFIVASAGTDAALLSARKDSNCAALVALISQQPFSQGLPGSPRSSLRLPLAGELLRLGD